MSAARADRWLLPEAAGTLEAEGDVEQTWNFRQQSIVREVDVRAARKAFDLQLPQLGPYNIAFTRNGRHMLMAGDKGHLAMVEWQRARLTTEVQVRGWD